MLKIGLVATIAAITPVQLKSWATGDCTLDSGEKFYYALHQSQGFVSFNDGKRREAFSQRVKEGGRDMGVIRHIGSDANITLIVDLDTGRGYMVVQNDNGRKVEGNAFCKMELIRR